MGRIWLLAMAFFGFFTVAVAAGDCDDNGSGLFAVPQSPIIQTRLSARF